MSLDCDVVVLAGGRGTRLADVLPQDVPKPLAPVAGKPFIHWQLVQLAHVGASRAILSVGWKSDSIRAALGHNYLGVQIAYSHESSPLGTGGAIRRALELGIHDCAIVMNGDTYMDVGLRQLLSAHRDSGALLTMCCIEVEDTSRFGRLKLERERIVAIEEKGAAGPGFINAGLYVLNRDLFNGFGSSIFSFEVDFLVPRVPELKPHAFRVHGDFVDIGVPADWRRAQGLFPRD